MGLPDERRCPVCGARTTPHCPVDGRVRLCGWFRCTREACRAVINFERLRGYQTLPGDVVRPFRIETA